MIHTAPARTRTRRTLAYTAVGLVVATAAIIGALDHGPASSAASSFSEVLRADRGGATSGADGSLTEEDGALPDGVSVFDDEYPGVAKLDPALLRALRAAATDAAHDGVELYVNSGWRSPEYQNRLRREAVSEYGSQEAADRWVATPDTSAHVTGKAVDIGLADAATWLSEHGARYGLCQTYRNEPWHYELCPSAVNRGCPQMEDDHGQVPARQH